MIAGAALWLASQGLDVLIQDDYRWTIVPEELMETFGTTCWLLALGYWLRSVLPVGVFPLKPVPGMLDAPRTIAPLPDAGPGAQAPTG
jgi:hypothetical protein